MVAALGTPSRPPGTPGPSAYDPPCPSCTVEPCASVGLFGPCRQILHSVLRHICEAEETSLVAVQHFKWRVCDSRCYTRILQERSN